MVKKYLIFTMLLFNLSNINSIAPKKAYTVLTYIAGDNSLEPFIDPNLQGMLQGANNNTNVLAFVNRKKSNQKFAKQLIFSPSGIYQDGNTFYDLDSGSVNTAHQAIEWAFKNFPADHYMLILWDHGSGSLNRSTRAVCYDDTTGNYFKDSDIISILETTTKIIGKKLDILAFDACLMADIEIAYAVMPYADYMVASQETIPGYGFDYKGLFSPLKNNLLTPDLFSKSAVVAYNNFYKNTSNNYTLSVIKINNIEKLTNSVDRISEMLMTCLKHQINKKVTRAIINASSPYRSVRFDEPDYLDLYNFLENLHNQLNLMDLSQENRLLLKKELINCLNIIHESVLFNICSPNLSGAHGISIYFPLRSIDKSYKTLVWYSKTKWGAFLNKFFKTLKTTG